MRGLGVLGPEFCSLLHTEAVLFVDDYKAEVVELHPILNQCVGANQNLHLARECALQNLAPFARLGGAR